MNNQPILRASFLSFMMAGIVLITSCQPASEPPPPNTNKEGFWVDLILGEPVAFEDMIDDLATADVIYLGEIHGLERHLSWQNRIVQALVERGLKPMILLEAIEHNHQHLGTFNEAFRTGRMDFEQFADHIQWSTMWDSYQDFQPLFSTIQKHELQFSGINAPLSIIRAVGKKGLAGLSPEERRQLPQDIQLDDPAYEQLLNILLGVHAGFDPNSLRPIFEAQVARDEQMAHVTTIATEFAKPVVVIAGAGHVRYGLGMPDRVQRRLPQAEQRIVLMSESGELVLSPEQKAQARELDTEHQDFRFINRPVGDYLNVLAPTSD